MDDIKLEVSHDKHQKPAKDKTDPKLEKPPPKNQPGVIPSAPTLPPAGKLQPPADKQLIKPLAKPLEPDKKLQQSSSMPDNPLKKDAKGKNTIQQASLAKSAVPAVVEPPPKPTKQELAMHRIEYSKNSIAENLKLLLGHYKEIGEKEMKLHGHNPEKEAEIREFLDGLKLQRRQRKARLRRLQQNGTKRQREQKERSFETEARAKERKLQVMKYLEESKLQRQDNQQQRLKEKERWEKFYKEFKKIKPLYVVKQEELRNALEAQRAQLEEKIAVIKMRNKPIDAQELQAHMERHRRIIEELDRQKAEEKEQWRKRIEEENVRLHELWKGESHKIVLEEKREQKEHSKEPFEKLKRMRDYRDIVRECYMPNTQRRNSQGSLDQDEIASDKPKGRRRYRYLNGVSYGEVYEPEHPQLSEAEQRRMGNAYLRVLRSLPKKQDTNSSGTFNSTAQQRLKLLDEHAERYKLGNSYLHSAPLRRKNRSVDLPSNASRLEVKDILERLRHENMFFEQKEKLLKLDQIPVIALQRQDRQREIDDCVVQTIEKKISLLEKLHNDKPQLVNRSEEKRKHAKANAHREKPPPSEVRSDDLE